MSIFQSLFPRHLYVSETRTTVVWTYLNSVYLLQTRITVVWTYLNSVYLLQTRTTVVWTYLNSVYLLQMIASTSPSGPKWLLFSNSSVLLEHLFSDIYIPFDCEFLVAREDPKGGLSLFEVYRANRREPLQSHLLAVGSQQSSLSWDMRSLYERRKDLFGATIRAASYQVSVLLIVIIMRSKGLAIVPLP
jgi:hypothetical protein